MLNVTDAVKTAYKSDSGATGFYLTIDNVEYASLTASKVQQGSVTLKESLTSSDYIDYSTAEKSELDFSIINTDANINSLTGKTIIAKQYAGTGNELVPLGIFTIKTPKANGDFLIDLVAYDNMDKFDIDVSKWWDDLVTWPITPLALLQSLCTYCGLTCDVVAADIINGSISITKNEDIDTTTGLNVLGWIQCICARWFKCDRATGHIKAVKLDSTVREIFSPSYTISDVSIADYTMPAYDALIIRSSESDIGTQLGTGTNPYIIQGNPLFYGFTNEQLQTVGTAILNDIQGFVYVPISAKVMCLPYLEVGDYVTVSTIANKTGSAPILVREMNSANLRIDTLTSAGTVGTKKYVSASKSVLVFNQRLHEFKNDLDTLSSTILKTQKDSISKVTVYYLQNNGATPSKEDTGWSTTMPIPITGQTMWSMQVYTKADDTTISKADPINITSTKGEKGDTGVGISTITTKYQGSANGTTAPTGTWLDTPPLLTDDTPYLWTRYTFTYTDNTTATSYTVTKKGDTGAQGKAGKSIKTFSTEYYLSSSSVEQTDGEWTNVFPTKTQTTYIWYRNIITYTDNTTATSNPVLDSSANNFYAITETNTTNISQLNDRITNEVQSITTVTTQLGTRQTATDANVSKLQQDTTDSLTNLNSAQASTAQDLADYKNTVTSTYYTKSEIDQQADSVNVKIQKAVEEAQNKTITTLTETVVDARGFTVNTAGDDTHTTIDGAGVMVKDAQNNDVANFKASGSEIQKLKVINDASIGAHNTQAYTDYELNEDTMENGDSIVGSADFWIGDVK